MVERVAAAAGVLYHDRVNQYVSLKFKALAQRLC